MRQMTGIGDHGQRRSRDEPVKGLGIGRVKVPTQIIWGDGDRIIPPAYAEAFHRLIPGSTLTMIPNAGHLPHVERTPAVTQVMQSFLRN